MSEKKVYKVVFQNQGEVWELYARSVGSSDLFGFVEVEELLFGERSAVVVDPSEDRLKHEFKGVRRTFIPMHAVVRIDQVDRQGTSRVSSGGKGEGGLTPFPLPVENPPKTPRKS